MGAIESSNVDVALFHCPLSICSSVARIADVAVDNQTVRLVCDLRHAYWVPISELSRCDPYWPVPAARPKYSSDMLYAADESCDHEVVDAPGGGVKCIKCPGWFCW